MNTNEWKAYVRAELLGMNRLRETESRKKGVEISRNDAALMWIDTQAERFRDEWRQEDGINRS